MVHSLNGDLLRSLDPPKGCLSPELIIVSREGFVLVKFDQGHICNFSINGRLLQNVNHRDVVHVRLLRHQNVDCGESIQYSLYLKVGGGGCSVKINIFTKQHFDLSLLKESANQIQFTFFFTKIMTLPDSRINEMIVLMNG